MSEKVKLLITYDIGRGQQQAYRKFVIEEFLPAAQELGLTPTDVWHTAYGNYPARLLGFVADDLSVVRAARDSKSWQALMRKLEGQTINLKQRVVTFSGSFQW